MDKQSRILITGATGFLGAHIIRTLLRNGYDRIFAMVRHDSSLHLIDSVRNKIKLVESDLHDMALLSDAIKNMDYIIHVAAKVSFSRRDKIKMKKTNEEGTANLVNLALENNIRKFIHISSVAALGRTGKQELVSENSKWVPGGPNSQYAISKYRAELEVWRAYHEGLPVVILNPSLIFGPGYWTRGTGTFFRQIDQGLLFYPTGNTGVVDVRDVSDMVVKAMESEITGQRFICSGHNMSYLSLFKSIAGGLGVAPPSKPFPRKLRFLVALYFALKGLLTGRKPTVTTESLRNAYQLYAYDNSKSVESFNFNYRDWNDTIEYTSRIYRQSVADGQKYGI